MRKMKASDAIGMVLGHDVTQIIPGKFKGPVLKKGHILQAKDVPLLLDSGNEYIYVLELAPGELHEDDAAVRLARVMGGPGVTFHPPSEGKVALKAAWTGLLRIDVDLLARINETDNIIVSTLHDATPCTVGTMVAATRIIPLTIEEHRIMRVEAWCAQGPVVDVLPYQRTRIAALVTGDEIFKGRINDSFDNAVGVKIEAYGATVVEKRRAPDDPDEIARNLREMRALGVDVILTTGGLSIDPGDVTRLGIQRAGAEIVSYGSPVLPGAMFCYAVLDGVPLLGLPACVFHAPTTIFDLIFPKVLADVPVTRRDIVRLGHGGLCRECDTCRYPVCPFGKG